MKLNITRKLLCSGLLLVFVPVLIVGLYAVRSFTSTVNAEAADHLQDSTLDLVTLVDTALQQEANTAFLLAQNPLYKSALLEQKTRSLSSDHKINIREQFHQYAARDGSRFDALWLADADGSLILGNDASGNYAAYEGLSVAERPYFIQGKQSAKVVVSEMLKSKASDKNTVVLFAPLMEKGHFIGALGISLDVSDIVKHIVDKKMGESGYSFAINTDGLITAHPESSLVLKRSLRDDEGMGDIFLTMKSGKAGMGQYSFEGETKTCAYASCSAINWIICSTIDDHELYAASIHVSRNILLILFLCCFIGGGISHFFARSITTPIKRVVEGLANGASEVSVSAANVAAGSQKLAESSSEQAASVEETSSSLEQMASMSNNSSENSSKVESLMGEASHSVAEVLEAMKNLSTSMEAIAQASEETQKIVKTIDEIAFQTNILALNAAVEAARAGEAGAGFAVVAEEVRNLAARSAVAAKDTGAIIQNTVERVLQGTSLLRSTDASFNKVVESINEVHSLVSEISESSREQLEGIQQISKAVAVVDQTIQSNASAAEESASAAEELKEQSHSMAGFVEVLTALVHGGSTAAPRSFVGIDEAAYSPKLEERSAAYSGKHRDASFSGFLN